MTKQALLKKILNDHYGQFFNYAEQERIIAEIWNDANGLDVLKDIVIDPALPNKARLIACEVIQQREFLTLHEEGVVEHVANIYAQALAENTTGRANSWGLLYEHDDKGHLGNRLVLLGQKAIPALTELLDKEEQYLYIGSETATVGNAYQFQVRDFAAYYLASILNEEVVYHESRQARNTAIEHLKQVAAKR